MSADKKPAWIKLEPADYLRSEWSGGLTIQLAIFPPTARYADRDFLWRISSASVELPESDFTPLPDYHRLISVLRGDLELSHNDGPAIRLAPYEVHAFEGGARTHSVGRCTDFNLMLRRGRAEGTMTPVFLSEQTETLRPEPWCQQLLLYCAEGSCTILPADDCAAEPAGETLQRGETLLQYGSAPLLSFAQGLETRLMFCQMRQIDP